MDLEDQVKHEADSNKIFCYVRDDAVPMRPGLNALKGSSHLSMYHNTRFEDSEMKVKKKLHSVAKTLKSTLDSPNFSK